MIEFIVGLVIGCVTGVFCSALCSISKNEEEWAERCMDKTEDE